MAKDLIIVLETIDRWLALSTIPRTKHITRRKQGRRRCIKQSVPQPPPVPLTKMMVLRSSTSEHFGLSVAGHGPTHIIRVQPNSCASRAALQAGDQLYSIGNINVQTYSQHRIVKLLKQQQLHTEFTVLRIDVNKPTVPAHPIGKVDVLPRTQSTKFSVTVFSLCDINRFLTTDCRAE